MIFVNILETISLGSIVPIISFVVKEDQNIEILNRFKDLISSFGFSNYLLVTLSIFLTIVFIKNIFFIFFNWIQSNYLLGILVDFQNKLYKKYLFENYLFHIKKNSSTLLRNITSEVVIIINSYLSPLFSLLLNFLLILFFTSFLLYYNFLSTSIIIISFLLIFIVLKIAFNKSIKNWGYLRQVYNKNILKNITEGLRMYKDIKLLGIESHFLKDLDKNLNLQKKVGVKRSVVGVLPRVFFEIFFIIFFSVILLLKINQINELLIMLAVYSFAIFRIMPSMNAMMTAYQKIQYGKSAITLIKDELKGDSINIEKEKKNNSIKFKDKIILKNLSYEYEKNKIKIINNLNLTIDNKKSIGIIGKSGEGKTTLINIILGLLKANEGEFYIDDLSMFEEKDQWQKIITYVPQNVFLIDGSIQENITFCNTSEKIDQERYKNAIKYSQLDEFINSLNLKDQTNVGEAGAKISEGQRQRIGIARAIYKKSQVLILDEATSSLDPATEKSFTNVLKNELSYMTIIFVSHRLSALDFCDEIYELKNGKLFKN